MILAWASSLATAAISVTWANRYEGNVMPASNSPPLNEVSLSASTDGNLLTINGTSGGYAALGPDNGGSTAWNGNAASGSTLEFRMKVDSVTSTYGAYMELGGTSGFAGLKLSATQAITFGASGDGTPFNVTTTAFHTYRMTLASGVVNFYLDGNETPFSTRNVSSSPYNAFDFGYGTGAARGTSEWDYVRWTNAGAFAAPEPSTAAAVALGLAMLIYSARARRTFNRGEGDA
jgi:hypothetical protein